MRGAPERVSSEVDDATATTPKPTPYPAGCSRCPCCAHLLLKLPPRAGGLHKRLAGGPALVCKRPRVRLLLLLLGAQRAELRHEEKGELMRRFDRMFSRRNCVLEAASGACVTCDISSTVAMCARAVLRHTR